MKIVVSSLIVALSLAAPLWAQETVAAERTQTAAGAAGEANALALSLDEAIRAAAEHNLGVAIERYDLGMSAESWRNELGIFDWFSNAELSSRSVESATATRIRASQFDMERANVGVRQLLPTGGTYEIGFDNQRLETNDPFAVVNPSFESSLGFNLSHPLLRNFGVDITRTNINIARNTLGITREDFRNVMMDTVLLVEDAYLDLIFARQNLEVQQQSLALAADQARITQIRIDVGAAAPLDILQPRVAVATREEQVIIAEAQVRAAEDRLRQLMNLPPEQWDRPIVPTEEVVVEPVEVDVDAAIALAYERRPEIIQARLGTESTRLQYNWARNQVLPSVDFTLDYGLSGTGGDRLVFDDVTGEPISVVSGGYPDAIDQITGANFPSWSVGFNVGVPVRNVGARANRARARLSLEQSQSREAQARQTIALQVRQAARDIETAQRQIVAARAAREAAEQNVEAERKRFENGLTTNFNVLEVQQQLADARSRELAALVNYRKAIGDYHRSVGDLLDVHDIRVDEPEPLRAGGSRLDGVRWLNYGYYAGDPVNDMK